MTTAFHCDPTLKQSLLDRLSAPEASTAPGEEGRVPFKTDIAPVLPEEKDVDAAKTFAAEFGLHPALTSIIDMLARTDPSFAGRFFVVLPPGVDTLQLVRRWLIWTAKGATPSLRDRITDPGKLAKLDRITEMHEDALSEAIDRKQWRQARAALADHATVTIEGRAVEALIAGAWNLDEAPGAAADTLGPWLLLLRKEAEQRFSWSEDDAVAESGMRGKQMEAAFAFAGLRPGAQTPEWLARFQEGGRLFNEKNPRKALDVSKAWNEAILGRDNQIQDALLRLATEAGTRLHAPAG